MLTSMLLAEIDTKTGMSTGCCVNVVVENINTGAFSLRHFSTVQGPSGLVYHRQG